MCGKFALSKSDLKNMLTDSQTSNEIFDYYPSQQILMFTDQVQSPKFMQVNWGFEVAWQKKAGSKLINARSEGIETKPTFNKAFAQTRCIIPVSGYYEWQKIGKQKIPWYFTATATPYLFLAGIYQKSSQGHNCVILTRTATQELTHIHHRMPLILNESMANLWLKPSENLNTNIRLIKKATANELKLNSTQAQTFKT